MNSEDSDTVNSDDCEAGKSNDGDAVNSDDCEVVGSPTVPR